MFIERAEQNPILKPKSIHSWEATAVFNGCPVKRGEKIYLLYRAISLPHYHALGKVEMPVSCIGIATSEDGIDFHDRKRLIVPEHDWEKFGCEDSRVTEFEGKYFIFYTALSTYPFCAEGIKVGLAISRDLKTIEEKHLVTPFNAKAMAIFPQRIEGKIWAELTVNTDKPPAKICLATFNNVEEIWQKEYWGKWYNNLEKHALKIPCEPSDHLESGVPPIKTEYGWLLIYSYIKDYHTPNKLFGVHAILLDLNNPFKILGRTKYPLMVPEEYYEMIGHVPDVIFPTGAFLRDNKIWLYYGAADTTCCLAFINLEVLIKKFLQKEKKVRFTREKDIPILTPNPQHSWEAKACFNPGVIYLGGKVHIIYRAISEDNTSVFGYATSKDGVNIDYRSSEPIYVPRKPFEQKSAPGRWSGCEDPRLTKIKDRIYMCYTAFDGERPPRIALTWIKEEDFLKKNWGWANPVLISPPERSDKDACIFPEEINGKFLIIHRISDDIDSALVSSLRFDGKTWLEEYKWIGMRRGFWDNLKVGLAAPPLKTKAGWILLYHGIDKKNNVYRIGAVLLDLKNPLKIIARTNEPLFEPELPFEQNIVFPCGAVILKDKIFMYYGAADKTIGVASIKIEDLLSILKT